jgi:hypothetical protein
VADILKRANSIAVTVNGSSKIKMLLREKQLASEEGMVRAYFFPNWLPMCGTGMMAAPNRHLSSYHSFFCSH